MKIPKAVGATSAAAGGPSGSDGGVAAGGPRGVAGQDGGEGWPGGGLPAGVPEVSVPRYGAPRVELVMVREVISSKALNGNLSAGHYQHVLLSTRTGTLSFHESTQHLEPWNPAWRAVNDVPRATWDRWHPGKMFSGSGPHMWFQPVPQLLSWTIDSGVRELPYLDVDAANSLLEEVAPAAQALLDGLYEADDLDWSADSAHAGRNIGRLTSRDRRAEGREADADLVDFGDIVERYPQVYKARIRAYSGEQLARECESQTRFLSRWFPEIKQSFGRPAEGEQYVHLDVLGVRAWYQTAAPSR